MALFFFLLIAAVIFLVYALDTNDRAFDRLAVMYDALESKYNTDMKLMNDRETQNREAYRWASARDVQENQRLRVANTALVRRLEEAGMLPTIRIYRDDTLPAFGGWAAGSLLEGNPVLLMNVAACLSPCVDEHGAVVPMTAHDKKWLAITTLMHEFGHALQEFFRMEFTEEEIEQICEAYQRHEDPAIKEIQRIKSESGPIEHEARILLDLAEEAQRTGCMPDLSRLTSPQA